MEIPDVRKVASNITNQDVHSVRKRNEQTAGQPEKNKTFERTDALVLSEEGKKALEIERYAQIGKLLPSVREDTIAKVKDRLQNGFYSNGEILKETARKLLGS
ncbi:flagellar biosynthesis anti-sigma factor FlgM [bacterium]|nr:flagellar biosynthesis anti-sigma factor FlgM [bacterium]MCP5462123.1 flagellar biosynthesis anti-sigma factor FlgM [bacterium]